MAVNVPAGDMFSKAFAEMKARLDRIERRAFGAITTPDHNALGGLQGGTALERYHLTEDEMLSVAGIPAIQSYLDAGWTYVQTTTFQAIQDAIDAASSGDTIYLPAGTYTSGAVTQINVNKSLTIRGAGDLTLLYQSNPTSMVFNVTASYVTIRDMSIRGPQYATYAADFGIKVIGTYTSYYTNICFENLRMFAFGSTAIWTEFVEDFRVTNCRLFQLQYGGFMGLSVKDGILTGNHIVMSPMSGTVNQYPIAISRASVLSQVTNPRSENVLVSNNLVEDSEWEGIDTHGGKDLTITSNTVRNCLVGIAMVPSRDAATNTDFLAPLNVTVTGNLVDSLVTNGSQQAGIKLVGPTNSPVDGGSLEYATGNITGNTVIGYGSDNGVNQTGGILLYGTKGVAVSGNATVNCTPNGICLYHTNILTSITGNTILSPWSTTITNPYGISLYSTYNEAFIGGNAMDLHDQLTGKTYYMTYGVYVSNSSTNKVSWGQNRITGYATGETNIGASVSSTHGFTDMQLVANPANPMFGLGRATAATGFPALTNTTTGATAFRTLQAGTNITITNPDGVAGNPIISASTSGGMPNLTGSTGIVAQTGASTYAARTLTNGTGISITNGNGVSGNPTINFTEYGAWTTFTPTWGGTVTNPALGNATVTASYKQLDANTLFISIGITMGSTTTYGSGNWFFSVSGFSMVSSPLNYGSGIITDASVAAYACTPAIIGTNRIYVYSGTGAAQSLIGPTAPFTWTTGDVLRFSVIASV